MQKTHTYIVKKQNRQMFNSIPRYRQSDISADTCLYTYVETDIYTIMFQVCISCFLYICLHMYMYMYIYIYMYTCVSIDMYFCIYLFVSKSTVLF